MRCGMERTPRCADPASGTSRSIVDQRRGASHQTGAIEEVGCELAIVGHTTVIEPQRGPVDDRALLDHHPDMAAHL
jgi:hypothetical protein